MTEKTKIKEKEFSLLLYLEFYLANLNKLVINYRSENLIYFLSNTSYIILLKIHA